MPFFSKLLRDINELKDKAREEHHAIENFYRDQNPPIYMNVPEFSGAYNPEPSLQNAFYLANIYYNFHSNINAFNTEKSKKMQEDLGVLYGKEEYKALHEKPSGKRCFIPDIFVPSLRSFLSELRLLNQQLAKTVPDCNNIDKAKMSGYIQEMLQSHLWYLLDHHRFTEQDADALFTRVLTRLSANQAEAEEAKSAASAAVVSAEPETYGIENLNQLLQLNHDFYDKTWSHFVSASREDEEDVDPYSPEYKQSSEYLEKIEYHSNFFADYYPPSLVLTLREMFLARCYERNLAEVRGSFSMWATPQQEHRDALKDSLDVIKTRRMEPG